MLGSARFVRLPWCVSPDSGMSYGAVPAIGEHSEYVYKQLLGIPDAEYDRLVRDNVVH